MFTLEIKYFGSGWEVEELFDNLYDAEQTGKFMLAQGLITNWRVL
ncbi:hypothetical protein ACQWNE_003979 [Escherichia coli]